MAYPGSLLHGLFQAAKKEAARLGCAFQDMAGAESASKPHTVVSRIRLLHGCWSNSLRSYWLEGQPQFFALWVSPAW